MDLGMNGNPCSRNSELHDLGSVLRDIWVTAGCCRSHPWRGRTMFSEVSFVSENFRDDVHSFSSPQRRSWMNALTLFCQCHGLKTNTARDATLQTKTQYGFMLCFLKNTQQFRPVRQAKWLCLLTFLFSPYTLGLSLVVVRECAHESVCPGSHENGEVGTCMQLFPFLSPPSSLTSN